MWNSCEPGGLGMNTKTQTVWVTGALITAYMLMVAFGLLRRFGHDELFTFYMAQSPTFSHLLEEIRNIDLNPPLSYLVTRGWQQLFGVTNFRRACLPLFCSSWHR